jgi:hypothetical protein
MKALEWLLVSLVLALGALGLGATVGAISGRVRNRERAAGVLPELVGLMDAWEERGTFDVVVAPGGGLRTSEDEQAGYAANGTSTATTLKDTPHGRGAALDLWPVAFLDFVPRYLGGTAARWATWAEVSEPVKLQFSELGRFGEALGLTWGGRWRSSAFPNGDQPHFQLPNWSRYPFPPRGVA